MFKKHTIPLFVTSLLGGIFFGIVLSTSLASSSLPFALDVIGILNKLVGSANVQELAGTATALFFILGVVSILINFAIFIPSGLEGIPIALFGYVAGFFIIQLPLVGIVLALLAGMVTLTLFSKEK